MNLLTNDELWKFCWNKPEVPEGEDDSMEAQFVAAARAIEAAVIAKLAQGVVLRPYRADCLDPEAMAVLRDEAEAAVAAAGVKALEDAAVVCDALWEKPLHSAPYCAKAIRTLKGGAA